MLQETAYWHNLNNPDVDIPILTSEQDILDSVVVVWSPPPQPKMKINFDGAAGPGGYAFAVVARNTHFRVDGCQAKVLEIMSPVEAQAYGALLSIELAISNGLTQIIIEGDSFAVINALRYHNPHTPLRIKNTISRSKDKLEHFSSVEFSFIKKEANVMARSLAAYVVGNHLSQQ
ncbi:uncharacterized protein LOC113312794 [Papaver somniferum]|uniref:uncharacterized protein LOC113312794 n=1 Tax=Papaver somniferum TaxID=3469 RepID=UPI000E6FCAC0|nr:uncharacterized protein LOC113312794 [Papaver somniferum]